MAKRRFLFSTTQIIMLSFLVAILMGSFLLALPISSASGKPIPYIDALFTATTATCVTGLVTVPTVTTWSIFGQIIILILIQVGGLGVITVMSGIMILLHRKIGFANRLLLQDAFNLNTLSGLVRFVKKVIRGTFIVEGIGALLYMTVFIPEFGIRGIWISIFNSVSAFCNAGIDIIANNSLCDYATHPLINAVTCLLIILGGIGFIVWWDVIRVSKLFKVHRFKALKHLSLHSKIAISATVFLIAIGAVCIFAFEYNNPLTLKNLSLFDKIQVSVFQSVTTRTAGFMTVPQENLTNASSFVSILLMFIGGSPVGTAGGIKTVTIVILIAAALATVKNNNETSLWQRTISKDAIRKAIAVVFMSSAILFISTVLLSLTCDAAALDILYETVSATATVGLTKNFTPSLNFWGKIIITATMYLGRIGPISLAFAFNFKKVNDNKIENPNEKISVG
ncbi:MAG: potassium transporter KtrB [Ruminococcaceae bacterium]|nr:potassium transporter KtrB [Oscillospiraceae bacterium]